MNVVHLELEDAEMQKKKLTSLIGYHRTKGVLSDKEYIDLKAKIEAEYKDLIHEITKK